MLLASRWILPSLCLEWCEHSLGSFLRQADSVDRSGDVRSMVLEDGASTPFDRLSIRAFLLYLCGVN